MSLTTPGRNRSIGRESMSVEKLRTWKNCHLSLARVFAVWITFWGGVGCAATQDLPNVLIILADDLGYGDVGCYNSESNIPTPHLDRLATQGMRFVDAHSPCTVCTPTRYSLMTGQMAFRTPSGGRVFSGAGGPSLIQPGRLTLPAMPVSYTHLTLPTICSV